MKLFICYNKSITSVFYKLACMECRDSRPLAHAQFLIFLARNMYFFQFSFASIFIDFYDSSEVLVFNCYDSSDMPALYDVYDSCGVSVYN